MPKRPPTPRPREVRAAGLWASGGITSGVVADLTVAVPAVSGTSLAVAGTCFCAAGWQLWQLRRRRVREMHDEPRG